ncbi:kinase-like domain-containing protein, partial [Pisolithus sp. B1]
EVYAWSKLRHKNIVPMFGISTEFDSTISIISEWMPLGNAHDYVKNTEHDPRPLVGSALKDIASGLYYLHSHELGVVHGDLKGASIHDFDRRALLTDFGLSTLTVSTLSVTVNNKRGFSLHWVAPELLDDGHASTASDVWAFGMTILELFTRAVPFSDCNHSTQVFRRLMQMELPLRPTEESTQFRMTDGWWEICTSCWERTPALRPIMKDIIVKVEDAMVCGLFFRPSPVEHSSPMPETTQQQQAIELSSVLHRLADRASRYSINLNGDVRRTLGRYPLRGGTAIVHHGTWIPHGTEVAIKTLLNALSESEAEFKRLFREVYTWSKLRHENIVPMLGISTEFDSTISIISEWMPLGNAHDYVKNPNHDPRPLLEDVASGLNYLHSHELGVVHGDLKGIHVLLSSGCRALLTGFDFATLNISTFSMTVTARHGITLHWAAPELLDNCRASMASDVWAFGMTILELFTRAVPFSDCNSSTQVLRRLMQGKLPPRPTAQSTQFRMTDVWWEICTSCWRHDPSSR